MPDRKTGKLHGFISVNGSFTDNAIAKVIKEYRDKYPNERFTLVRRELKEDSQEGMHAEAILLDYAKKYQLKIMGIGASRPFCRSCCELLEGQVDQEALGQILYEGRGREKSSKHWRGSRGGGKRRRVSWEIDDKDIYFSDSEKERASIKNPHSAV
jgi:hypothetical protein